MLITEEKEEKGTKSKFSHSESSTGDIWQIPSMPFFVQLNRNETKNGNRGGEERKRKVLLVS